MAIMTAEMGDKTFILLIIFSVCWVPMHLGDHKKFENKYEEDKKHKSESLDKKQNVLS